MSSGSKIKLYMCEETVAGTTPVSPEWFVVPRVTDSLTENVTTEVSAIVADTRFRQGSTPTEAEITGDLATELSVGTFDKFISAVAMNEWVVDGVDPNKSTLNFGGSVRKTFTFVKVYSDIGQVFIYRGIYINSMSFQLATTGKVNINFALVGTGFEQTTVNPVSSATDMSGTPLVSALNVNTFTVDGATTVNTACVQSANVDITNNYEAVRCLGGGKLTAQKYIEKIMDITLATQFAFGTQSAAYIEHIKSRVKMAVAFKIEDSLGNSYEFSFPTLEVSEANHPDAGGEDLVYLDVNFTQVVESPVITRILA